MLIAQRLFDNFINSLNDDARDKVYSLASSSMNEAMAQMANLYEKQYGDYPTGLVAAFIHQHLEDKLFQRGKQAAAA
ncbi:MAG TPA: hypothetical protein V6C96_00860 [Vampirovibrionales bacterium]